MIPSQRQLFAIPDDVVYLNCASTSPLPASAEQAGREAMAFKRTPWLIGPEGLPNGPEAARAGFANILGCDAEGVALVPSVSFAMAVAARNLPLDAGSSVLVLHEEFPSNVFPWLRMAPGRVKALPRPKEGTWSEAVIEAITEDIGLVALPHCHWMDGTVFDLGAVRAACDRVGAHLVVDATQSLGAMPFDFEAARPDFVAATGHKWLLCPHGVGFCYVAPKWREGEPIEENWKNRLGSEDYSRLTEYESHYRPGARRYDLGEVTNSVLLPMATESLRLIAEWGVGNIAETLSAVTRKLALHGQAFGLTPTPAAERAPHMLGLRLPHGPAKPVAEAMAREKVYVSPRSGTLRIAPHLFVNAADVDRFTTVLSRSLST